MTERNTIIDAMEREKRNNGSHQAEPDGDAKEPEADRTPGQRAYSPRLYTSAEFFRTEFRREFLVRGVLVKNQPAVIGGARKMLKSGIGIDLAVSLDTATPFLSCERFAVPERCNVLLINGESGESTVQETARRIAEARGLTQHDLGIVWSSDLPQLANAEHLADLADLIRKHRFGFVGVDPAYLCLVSGFGRDGPQASNLFDMGPVYSAFARCCLDAGATPALFFHCKKNRTNEPPDLDDLAYAGIAEFARQWLLLSRREKYQSDGLHKFWLSIGGSAGHAFLGELDVDEGVMKDDFTGRRWRVELRPFSEAAEERKREREDMKLAERQSDEFVVIGLIDGIVAGGEAATLNRIRNGSGLSRPRTDGALERLRQQRLIVEYQADVKSGRGGKQLATAYRRVLE